MAKMKRLYKINIAAGEAAKAIHVRYFVSMGLATESGYAPESEEFKAAYLIKFGDNEYRRAAWLNVRDEVEKQVPATFFAYLNDYFVLGAAEHFTTAFDYKTRQWLKLQTQKRPDRQ